MKNYTFAGLEIAPANVIFKNGHFSIAENWEENSYYRTYGKEEKSTYFNYHEAKKINIDGWRLPTYEEWKAIIGNSRAGATVNGTPSCRYAHIQLTGVEYAGSCLPNGLLLFPDGATITGKTLNGVNNRTLTIGVTLLELNAFLNQGCAFLPAFGMYNDMEDDIGGNYIAADFYNDFGAYWCITEDDGEYGDSLYFDWFEAYMADGNKQTTYKTKHYLTVRLIRRLL